MERNKKSLQSSWSQQRSVGCVCMCVCVCACVCMCVCLCVCACACMRTCVRAYVCVLRVCALCKPVGASASQTVQSRQRNPDSAIQLKPALHSVQ